MLLGVRRGGGSGNSLNLPIAGQVGAHAFSRATRRFNLALARSCARALDGAHFIRRLERAQAKLASGRAHLAARERLPRAEKRRQKCEGECAKGHQIGSSLLQRPPHRRGLATGTIEHEQQVDGEMLVLVPSRRVNFIALARTRT